jgi:hypothetical protein
MKKQQKLTISTPKQKHMPSSSKNQALKAFKETIHNITNSTRSSHSCKLDTQTRHATFD